MVPSKSYRAQKMKVYLESSGVSGRDNGVLRIQLLERILDLEAQLTTERSRRGVGETISCAEGREYSLDVSS
jgi:hypothetical protein